MGEQLTSTKNTCLSFINEFKSFHSTVVGEAFKEGTEIDLNELSVDKYIQSFIEKNQSQQKPEIQLQYYNPYVPYYELEKKPTLFQDMIRFSSGSDFSDSAIMIIRDQENVSLLAASAPLRKLLKDNYFAKTKKRKEEEALLLKEKEEKLKKEKEHKIKIEKLKPFQKYWQTMFFDTKTNDDKNKDDYSNLLVEAQEKIKDYWGRLGFVYCLNQHRSEPEVSSPLFKFIGGLAYSCLTLAYKNMDSETTRMIIGMCQTYYRMNKEHKQYLQDHIKHNPLWKNTRFWDSVVFDTISHERLKVGLSNSKWMTLSNEEKILFKQMERNICFGQLGVFTTLMVYTGNKVDIVKMFVTRMCDVLGLGVEFKEILHTNVQGTYHILQAEKSSLRQERRETVFMQIKKSTRKLTTFENDCKARLTIFGRNSKVVKKSKPTTKVAKNSENPFKGW